MPSVQDRMTQARKRLRVHGAVGHGQGVGYGRKGGRAGVVVGELGNQCGGAHDDKDQKLSAEPGQQGLADRADPGGHAGGLKRFDRPEHGGHQEKGGPGHGLVHNFFEADAFLEAQHQIDADEGEQNAVVAHGFKEPGDGPASGKNVGQEQQDDEADEDHRMVFW